MHRYRTATAMKKFTFCITPNEYQRFRTNPSTRLYIHSYDGNQITIETSNKRGLADDLMKVIDFGATSATEVLNSHQK